MGTSDEKELPLFSPVNLLIAGIAVAILILAIVVFGNRIFNPGDLSSSKAFGTATSAYLSHVDFEHDCQLCHQPLQTRQAGLCVQCHQDIDEQMTQQSGLHGQMANAAECRACHPDHRGRDFDLVQFARQNFDHASTGFILDSRHTTATCQNCHTPDSLALSADCASCHEEPPVHVGIFSKECGQCHTGEDWQIISWQSQPFDHELTGFSLINHPANVAGSMVTCVNCHNPDSGSTSSFACQDCHARQNSAFIEEHVVAFGQTCTECHDGVDRMRSFDHNAVFALEGRHLELTCANCHNGQTFNETETVCATCHEEPDIHAGFFGQRCQMCHIADGWQPARLSIHEFPLDHGTSVESSCETCHSGAYTSYTCYTCHDHQETQIQSSHRRADIPEDQIPDCIVCHVDGLIHVQP